MKQVEIEKKVKEVLADKLDISVEKIKAASSLKDDLGIDSFGAIELIFAIEEKFGIDIPDEDMVNVKLVQDIIDYVVRQIEKREDNTK